MPISPSILTLSLAPSADGLLLPIPGDQLAPPGGDLDIEGWRLQPKQELHVTLLGRRRLAELLAEGLDRPWLDARVDRMPAEWRVVLGSEFALVAEPDWAGPGGEIGRASLVRWASCEAADGLYTAISRRLGRRVAPPPLHVTLWTDGDPTGISIPDAERLAALRPRPIPHFVICNKL